MRSSPGDIPPLTDELVEAYLDGELHGLRRRRFLQALGNDPIRRRRLLQTCRALDLLRRPVDAPDLTDEVLRRVRARRPCRVPRHFGRLERGLLAASMLLGLLVIAAVYRAPSPPLRPLTMAEGVRPPTAEVMRVAPLGALSRSDDSRLSVGWAPPSLRPGHLPTVHILPSDAPPLIVVSGGSRPASLPLILVPPSLDPLPSPREAAWVWSGGPGRTLSESLRLFPAATDPSANFLWPAVDPLLLDDAHARRPASPGG